MSERVAGKVGTFYNGERRLGRTLFEGAHKGVYFYVFIIGGLFVWPKVGCGLSSRGLSHVVDAKAGVMAFNKMKNDKDVKDASVWILRELGCSKWQYDYGAKKQKKQGQHGIDAASITRIRTKLTSDGK